MGIFQHWHVSIRRIFYSVLISVLMETHSMTVSFLRFFVSTCIDVQNLNNHCLCTSFVTFSTEITNRLINTPAVGLSQRAWAAEKWARSDRSALHHTKPPLSQNRARAEKQKHAQKHKERKSKHRWSAVLLVNDIAYLKNGYRLFHIYLPPPLLCSCVCVYKSKAIPL